MALVHLFVCLINLVAAKRWHRRCRRRRSCLLSSAAADCLAAAMIAIELNEARRRNFVLIHYECSRAGR